MYGKLLLHTHKTTTTTTVTISQAILRDTHVTGCHHWTSNYRLCHYFHSTWNSWTICMVGKRVLLQSLSSKRFKKAALRHSLRHHGCFGKQIYQIHLVNLSSHRTTWEHHLRSVWTFLQLGLLSVWPNLASGSTLEAVPSLGSNAAISTNQCSISEQSLILGGALCWQHETVFDCVCVCILSIMHLPWLQCLTKPSHTAGILRHSLRSRLRCGISWQSPSKCNETLRLLLTSPGRCPTAIMPVSTSKSPRDMSTSSLVPKNSKHNWREMLERKMDENGGLHIIWVCPKMAGVPLNSGLQLSWLVGTLMALDKPIYIYI